MPAIQPNVTSRRGAFQGSTFQGSTFVVMVGDDPCTIRATGVCPIADVLAVPEAERLGWEEMESLGIVDALDGAEEPRSLGGGMIVAPRLRRRQRAVSSRAMFFSGPRG
ncbi:MAG: hypothetical protein WCJ31_05435 [Planctomycetia bacterium]